MAFISRDALHGAHGRSACNAARRRFGRLHTALAATLRLLRTGRRIRKDLAALSRLDAHMLRDIGISRWDVERLQAGSHDGPDAGI